MDMPVAIDEVDAGGFQLHLASADVAEVALIYKAKEMHYEMCVNVSSVLLTEIRQYIAAVSINHSVMRLPTRMYYSLLIL